VALRNHTVLLLDNNKLSGEEEITTAAGDESNYGKVNQ
jgi:hypothetical protein